MIGVAIKGLLGRKLRATLTGFAIVLGVAMISGAFVLTDTLGKSFDSIFNESYKSTDAVISSKAAVGIEHRGTTRRPRSPADVLCEVEGLPGVRVAQGSIEDHSRLVNADGNAIGSADEGIAFGIAASTADESLNPLQLVTGQWPQGDGQIAVDKSTADRAALHGGPDGRRVRRGPDRRTTGSAASSASGRWARSARPRSRSSTSRPRRACSTSSTSSTRSASAPSRACPTPSSIRQITPLLSKTTQVKSASRSGRGGQQ